MDFANTRQQNDALLLSRLETIRSGQELDVLEPFARAYLGLFYDIDNQLAAVERIDLLANPDLSSAIKQGMMRFLSQASLPSPDAIARAMLKQQTLAVGQAVLAGISLQAARQPESVFDLPDSTLSSAICFHHAISTFHDDCWYEPLLIKKPQLAAEALLSMWQVLLEAEQNFLPGLRPVLTRQSMLPVFSFLVVPLLKTWRHCRHRELAKLLSLSMRYVDSEVLLETAQHVLSDTTQMNLRNQIYWHGTVFLLAPEDHGQDMINFMGQDKIKLLPLLDFVVPLLNGSSDKPFKLSAVGYAYLIRCLAQKFTPQIDFQNNISDVTARILWLFYQLACFSTIDGGEALKWLQRIRVLKLYSDIFDAVAVYQSQAEKPDYQTFIQTMQQEDRLRMKKNRHD